MIILLFSRPSLNEITFFMISFFIFSVTFIKQVSISANAVICACLPEWNECESECAACSLPGFSHFSMPLYNDQKNLGSLWYETKLAWSLTHLLIIGVTQVVQDQQELWSPCTITLKSGLLLIEGTLMQIWKSPYIFLII